MFEYLVVAHDYPNNLEKRMEVRPRHLAYVQKYKDSGELVIGGAQLSEEKTMKGSAIIFRFSDENSIKEYLANEPYILEGVWEHISVTPFKTA
jgi:uncharacterized protein